MDPQTQQIMRRVPSVDSVLREPELETLAAEHGRKLAADCVRDAIDEVRQQIATGAWTDSDEAAVRSHVVAAATC